jgi:hypothetical protein
MSFRDYLIKTVTEQQINPVDVTAGGAGIMAYLKFAPDVAAAFTVFWLGLRIFIAFRDEVFKKKDNKNADK